MDKNWRKWHVRWNLKDDSKFGGWGLRRNKRHPGRSEGRRRHGVTERSPTVMYSHKEGREKIKWRNQIWTQITPMCLFQLHEGVYRTPRAGLKQGKWQDGTCAFRKSSLWKMQRRAARRSCCSNISQAEGGLWWQWMWRRIRIYFTLFEVRIFMCKDSAVLEYPTNLLFWASLPKRKKTNSSGALLNGT